METVQFTIWIESEIVKKINENHNVKDIYLKMKWTCFTKINFHEKKNIQNIKWLNERIFYVPSTATSMIPRT